METSGSRQDFKDLFSKQASDYARCRPRYPRQLFEYLASLTQAHELAWDCGTGNGQAACGLADDFDQVIATDPSREQLLAAPPHPRVRYMVGPAEQSPLADASCDLVTAAQCAHWFDLPRFFEEVRRIGKPDAVVALWCYGNGRETTPALARVLRRYAKLVRPYWEPEMRHVWKHFETLPFPFEELQAPPLYAEIEWALDELKGYLRSWSATQTYLRVHGVDPWTSIENQVSEVWGPPDARHRARWRIHFRVGWISRRASSPAQ